MVHDKIKKIIAIFLLLSTVALSGTEQNNKEKNKPEPYVKGEFPDPLYDLRRASIIFCGAFPLGYMYTSLVTTSLVKIDDGSVETKLFYSLIFSGIITLIDFIIEKLIGGNNYGR